jgi:hypothetical protein
MIETLIAFVVVVVVVAGLAYFLRWVMGPNMLAVPDPIRKGVWVVFALIVLLALLGFAGYGPFRGWR